MSRKLLCTDGHEWCVDDGPSGAGVPCCAACGAPAGLGSEVGWECKPLLLSLQVIVASLPVLAFGGLIVLFDPDRGSGRPWKVGGVILLIAWYAALAWLAELDGERRLRECCRALGMNREGVLSAERLAALPDWELKGRLARWYSALSGRVLGESVLVCEVQLRWPGKFPPRMTVVVFDDPIPGLPDFDLEPIDSPRLLRFSELVAVWRGTHRPAFAGEPLGRVYRLQGADPAPLEQWLPRPCRDLLARHPGWVIQARGGRLLVCQQYRVCPVEGLPTLLAVAYHLRQLFLAGAVLPSSVEGAGQAEPPGLLPESGSRQ